MKTVIKTLVLAAILNLTSACTSTPTQANAMVWYYNAYQQEKQTNLVPVQGQSVPVAPIAKPLASPYSAYQGW